ncbi:MAG: transcriptional regulator, LysR family [Verrucomicrobia bacterium]|jgi:DNA-binding transcriptional LysR family regulator|nr:transcriptional regulator, LysR family [Verrucomicrobiota bacterium]
MHEYLNKHPFDLYDLNLFQLVADTGSFTQAAQQAGLTQSAVTRQIRGMEEQLGVTLFERTTRKVHLTVAGQLLLTRSREIMQSTESLVHELQQTFQLVPQTLRIGVARSIGLAYLPGYFFAFQRKFPKVQLHVTQQSSNEIIVALEARTLDAGLLCPPRRLPRGLEITHRFDDQFTLIVPPNLSLARADKRITVREAKKLLKEQRWLLLDPNGNTGRLLTLWLDKQNWAIEPAMELDSFDTIVNLVSLGLGVSLVPHRVLPLYEKRRAVQRVLIKPTFQREVAVVVRKGLPRAEPLQAFVENVLF